MNRNDLIVIGAGPAGLTAANESLAHGYRPIVFESDNKVGGIARTEVYKGYRFDIGGHRFYTQIEEIEKLWKTMLGEEFRKVPRMSRIHYADRFFSYPLEILNALYNLGVVPSLLILASYVRWKIKPYEEEHTFDRWVTNRFGRRLFRTFFKTYTEKVWGIPCTEIKSDWAAQRIRNMSLKTAIFNALFGGSGTTSLIREFDYPRLGPGMMWERFASAVEKGGGEVHLNTEVLAIHRDGPCINGVTVRLDGVTRRYDASQVITSMPIVDLIARLDPPPPPEVLNAASHLSYRAFLIVGLIVGKQNLFPDNWIYIHNPGVKVGRIQNFGNWSPDMLADPSKSSVGMEYFCDEGDTIWTTPDDELIKLAKVELQALGLAQVADVEDGVVIRQPRAYPVYDSEYRTHLDVLREFLVGLDNLQTIGRNGMHRYNNQDHSMLTGILAVRNLLGEKHDLWNVNTERSYYEEFSNRPAANTAVSHRLADSATDDRAESASPSAADARVIPLSKHQPGSSPSMLRTASSALPAAIEG